MRNYKPVIFWLFTCCFMVFAMAVIGAITRLTESGLSITEWKPITGALPPLNEAAWMHQFTLYQQSPEFAAKHSWMALADFKKIFFWEWFHRLWGRAIGVIFALPLLWFFLTKKIPPGYGWKFLGLLVIGGAQGFIGWFMVQSGLIERPSVSHFRLALHLDFALLIFALMLWMALDLLRDKKPSLSNASSGLVFHGWLSLALLCLTITWGAFTAGLDAGMIYNSFPLMNGSFFPPEKFSTLGPIADAPWVQFTHRWLAIITGGILLWFAIRTKSWWLAGAVFIQVSLGIATLLTQVLLPLAALHQAGAIVLLSLVLIDLNKLMPARARES